MKKYLFVLLLLTIITFSATAQVKVIAPIITNNAADTYPTHFDTLGRGGRMSVENIANRNAIPTARRTEGMNVYVRTDKTSYTLQAGLTNSDWTPSLDTTLLSTRLWRQKGIDSVAALDPIRWTGISNYTNLSTNAGVPGFSNIWLGLIGPPPSQTSASKFNTFIGIQPGYYVSTGSYNIALGKSSLFLVGSGNNNIGIGHKSGGNLTSGNNNIAIGTNVGFPSATGSNQMNIAGLIYGINAAIPDTTLTASSTPSATGMVGFGVTAPLNRVHIANNASLGAGYSGLRLGITSNTATLGTASKVLSTDVNGDVGLYALPAGTVTRVGVSGTNGIVGTGAGAGVTSDGDISVSFDTTLGFIPGADGLHTLGYNDLRYALKTISNTYTPGAKQIFAANGTNAGFRLAGVTTNPSALATGDLWYRSDENKLRYYDGTTVRALVGEALAQALTNKNLNSSTNTFPVFTYANGGTGLNILGTANQLLRINAGATALEYFTLPSYLTAESDALALKIANNLSDLNSVATARSNLGGTQAGVNLFTIPNPGATTVPVFNADNTVSALSPSAFKNALGATTVGTNFFALANPNATSFPRINSDNTVSTLNAADFRTAIGAADASSSTVYLYNTVTTSMGGNTVPLSPTGNTVYSTVSGYNASLGATASARISLWTENKTIKNLYVLASGTQPAGGMTVRVLKNGNSTSLFITIPAGTIAGAGAYFSNTTDSFTLAPGEYLSYQIVNNATSGSPTSATLLTAGVSVGGAVTVTGGSGGGGSGSGSVTNITATNNTGQTWSITNPSSTPNLNLTLTKSAVGLSSVDNTTDAAKPVSTATQTALDAKQNTIDFSVHALSSTSPSINGNNDWSIYTLTLTQTTPPTLSVSNIIEGKTYTIKVIQDASGNKDFNLPANSLVRNGDGLGTDISLSTIGGSKDIVQFVKLGSEYWFTAARDFR